MIDEFNKNNTVFFILFCYTQYNTEFTFIVNHNLKIAQASLFIYHGSQSKNSTHKYQSINRARFYSTCQYTIIGKSHLKVLNISQAF
jgi:hypothetical protein